MKDKKPEVVSKTALFIPTVFPLLFAIGGVYTLLIGPHSSFWTGIVFICIGAFIAIAARLFSLVLYSDRIVLKYIFNLRTRTVFLKDVSSYLEIDTGKGDKAIILYGIQEGFSISSRNFSNYNDIRDKLAERIPVNASERQKISKLQVRNILVTLFLIAVITCIVLIIKHYR